MDNSTQFTKCSNESIQNTTVMLDGSFKRVVRQSKTCVLRDITNTQTTLPGSQNYIEQSPDHHVYKRKSSRYKGLFTNVDSHSDDTVTDHRACRRRRKTTPMRVDHISSPLTPSREGCSTTPTMSIAHQLPACHLENPIDYNDKDFNFTCADGDESEPGILYSGHIGDTFSLEPLNIMFPATVTTYTDKHNSDYLDEGDAVYICQHCEAMFWYGERLKKDNRHRNPQSFSMCCQQGKVVLPQLRAPPPMLHSLFFDKTTMHSKNFNANIRQYNNMFSFTSMGGKINHSNNNGGGPYSFTLSGMNYHNIGSLLPIEGQKPAFSQLYIFDTENEVPNRIAAVSKHLKDSHLDPFIVSQIKKTLDEHNPFVQQYRYASAVLANNDANQLQLCLLSSRQHDGRNYNLPTCSEVAALIVGDIDMTFNVRDIIIEKQSGHPKRIHELHASYLPLQYPLLFPYGEDGYRDDVEHKAETLAFTKRKKRVSMREFFAYRLMNRASEVSALLHASRLLQQFIVDAYTMIESQRLLWVRTHQKELRVELYQGLSEAVLRGETDASSTGRRIILPSSFTGGARYMLQNYQDAMALCRWAGYPDIFLTFTCNPTWPEVTRYCERLKLHPSCKPEILTRIFKVKLYTLMKTIKDDKIFGHVRAEVYTIEFQKRGLPHAHILLFLQPQDKITTTDRIDELICAEIPDQIEDARLYELVKKYMTHGPCGNINPKSPCMKDKKCSKYFPKRFNDQTTMDDEGYPTYRRRDSGRSVVVKGTSLDNRFVVPYNSVLLQKFEAHINVEKCNQSTAIKYLFKYISKGNDRVVAGIFNNAGHKDKHDVVDEIQQFYNCRYISACEAAWRIYGFEIHHRYPGIERLSFHLPNQQSVIYANNADVVELLDKPRVCESQFLAWMKMNDEDPFARTLTYQEFPNHYVYQKVNRLWKRRQKGFAVGRIGHASPTSGELYYLRVLLTKVIGPSSFDEMKTVDGILHATFRDACYALGLLDDDNEYIAAIKESSLWSTGNSLRNLFVSMLLCCCLQRPDNVWNQCAKFLSEDLLYINRQDPASSYVNISSVDKEQLALRNIDILLQKNGKSLKDFPSLPCPSDSPMLDVSNNLILHELSYNRDALHVESNELVNALNVEQKHIMDAILSSLDNLYGGFFFVYGYGGTGKTFLWKALTSTIRARGDIVIPVASSGIAATLLPSGRTAHSRFSIPIDITEFSMCSIKHDSALANLIRRTKLIIWDEAPMVQRYCIEAFDRTLRDIMQSNAPFGGKCIVMGGDFRQILPVIPKGTRADIVNACITSSHLWDHCKIFHLTQNMRLVSSPQGQDKATLEWFSNWLLDVGDGNLGNSKDGFAEIEIPPALTLPTTPTPMETMVSSIYDNLVSNIDSNDYFNARAILAPTIAVVKEINSFILSLLPGESYDYLSCDSVCKSTEDIDNFDNLYTTEFLNTITSSGLPSHKLSLKVGAPIMLLRNIDQCAGLCNGTRLRVTKLGKSVIEGITLNGSNPNQKVLIHRMDLNPSDTRLPFRMRRRQFPVTLSFAMTINKSQGQSLSYVGLYLSRPCFSHGQLYVALSRVKSMNGLKIYVPENVVDGRKTASNVVYKEIFFHVQQPLTGM